MGMDQIWERLAPETRDWLVTNNGDAVPVDIAAEIDDLVDAVGAEDLWAIDAGAVEAGAFALDDELDDADEDPGARYLADEAVDWIEELANDE